MDKEKLITIVIGLAVGIVIASAYFFAIKFLPRLSSFNPPKVTYTPPARENPPESQKKLVVDKPDDNSVAVESPIDVRGFAPAAAKILIFANAEEKIASADATGNFSASLKLEDGANEISFSLLSDSGIIESVKRNVILEIKP